MERRQPPSPAPPEPPGSSDRAPNPPQESLSVNDILRGKGPKVNDHHGGRHNAYMAHKIAKLGDQNAAAGSEVAGIFKGCALFVNGYTDPPINELKRIIAVNGGKFNQYETPDTTHFVCNHYPQTKLDRLKKGLEKRKIFYVTVKWVMESVSAGLRLREPDYRPGGLYDSSTRKLAAGGTGDGSGGVRPLSGSKRSRPSLSEEEGKSAVDTLEASSTDLDTESAAIGGSSSIADPPREQPATTAQPAAPSRRNAENDPNFIEHFFESSRLHFIGTWRSRLPALYDECVSSVADSAPFTLHHAVSTDGVASGSQRVVLHLDMDCFFVSVLLRGRDDLKDVPVAVAHSKASSQRGYSEISSCNYPARSCGLKNGMFMLQAVKLCPHLQVLHYDFEQYASVSEQVYRIMFSTVSIGTVVQPVSVDEAYIELPPGSDGYKVATDLRNEIRSQTGCAASVGIGSSMLLARLATKRAKPDGIFTLKSDSLSAHLSNMPVRDLPGVGYKHARILKEKGCTECKDIWAVPLSILKKWVGEALATQVYNFSRGIDTRPLKPVATRKSVGVDINYGIRFTSVENAEQFMGKMSQELASRLRQANCQGRTVTLKLMVRRWEVSTETSKFLGHGKCDTKSRSTTMTRPLNNTAQITRVVMALFQDMVADIADRIRPLMAEAMPSNDEGNVIDGGGGVVEVQVIQDLRGIGMQISKLSPIGEEGRSTTLAPAAQSGASNSIRRYIGGGVGTSVEGCVGKLIPSHSLCAMDRFGDQVDNSSGASSDEDASFDIGCRYLKTDGGRLGNINTGERDWHQELDTVHESVVVHEKETNVERLGTDYVTASQFDFLMSVAEGAPELLSQVKEQISAGARQPAPQVFDRPFRGEQADASISMREGDVEKDNTGCENLQLLKPVYTPRWPREPLGQIRKSLQEWVEFAELLEASAIERVNNPVSVRETFPSHKMIEVLCDYVVDLLRSKQADQAVLFNRLVQRVFINRGEQFEAAISRVRETTLDASTKYCHGKIQL